MKQTHRLTCLVAILLASAAVLNAQASDYTLRIYPVKTPQATAPITPATLLSANVLCNQTAPVSTSTRNPNKAVWDDPANAGKVCVWTDPGTGPLLGTPTGFAALEATLTMIGGGAETDESNRAPFSKTPPPPGRVRLVK